MKVARCSVQWAGGTSEAPKVFVCQAANATSQLSPGEDLPPSVEKVPLLSPSVPRVQNSNPPPPPLKPEAPTLNLIQGRIRRPSRGLEAGPGSKVCGDGSDGAGRSDALADGPLQGGPHYTDNSPDTRPCWHETSFCTNRCDALQKAWFAVRYWFVTFQIIPTPEDPKK